MYDFFNEVGSSRSSMFRIGEVSSIDPASATARVVFDDDNSLVSGALQVMQWNTWANKDFHMPDVGEDVLCLFLESGVEEGFILGAVYAGEVTPPESSGDKRTVVFKDGSRFSFDRSSSTLSITIGATSVELTPSTVRVETSSNVSVKSGGTVNIEAGSVCNVKATSMVNISAPVLNLTMGSTKMTLNSSSGSIESQNLKFKGAMEITGNLSVQGSQSVSGNIAAGGTVSGTNI
jgi:phage baseplate assembly protein V